MSNISRRDFLKTAGVMTLAVAAAGVLAGCNTTAAPAPEANKPEVKPASVSYTGYNGDKLTVESLGRFKVYSDLDKKIVAADQTVLKVTYTVPQYNTVASIELNKIEIASQNDKKFSSVVASANAVIADKLGLKNPAYITSMTNTELAPKGTLSVEKYIVLDVNGFKTNDLNVTVSYTKDAEGEGNKKLTLPLTVTASELY